MYRTADGSAVVPDVERSGGMVLLVLTGLLVWLGVWPTPLIELIRTTAVRMF